MKILNILLLILFVSMLAFGQKTDRTSVTETTKWKVEKVEKFGFQSVSIPENWTVVEEETTKTKNAERNITTTTFTKYWKDPKSAFEFNLHIETDANNAKVAEPPLDAETPLSQLLLSLISSLKDKCKPNGSIEEADFYDIDGDRGILTRKKFYTDEKQVYFTWQTFRYFENKSQRITFWTSSLRTENETARKIIDSVKLKK